MAAPKPCGGLPTPADPIRNATAADTIGTARLLWVGRRPCECGWSSRTVVWEDGTVLTCPACQANLPASCPVAP